MTSKATSDAPEQTGAGSRLEKRFLFANLSFFLLVAIVMLALATGLLSRLAHKVSLDYAGFYSARAIGILNKHLKGEIALMTRAAHSRAISDWFADEFNEEKRRLAHEEMQGFMEVLYGANVYFAINASLNEFSIDKGTPYSQFVPYDVVKEGRYEDLWYFECLEAKTPYLLNVDIDKLKQRKRVWINYRLEKAGKILGALCTALEFDSVVDEIFGAYDTRQVRGVVIDGDGIIQLDSAIEDDAKKLIFDSSERIQNQIPDPAFVAAINAHLGDIRGFFTGQEKIGVFEIEHSHYGYASIAAIEGSDWSVITFFNPSVLFSIKEMLPSVLAILVLFVLYGLAITVMNRRLIVAPLTRLTGSLRRLEEGAGELYGTGRSDEFGDLARTVRDMKAGLDHSNAVLTAASEKAQQASKAKTEFLANMSHEMRTPLNAVIGMANIARGSADMDKIRQCLAKIENASVHLVGLINDVLDMSKIESGKLELVPAEFNFPLVMSRTAEVTQHRMIDKKQHFIAALDENIPNYLVTDEKRLVQVLTNLLGNAEKFTPEGGSITLEAHLLEEKDGQCLIEISVTDSGIGISAETQKRLFQSFEQADSGISRRFGGTGLGLAISRRIVNLMGGDIGVESEEKVGSRFFFTFTALRGTGEGRDFIKEMANFVTCPGPECQDERGTYSGSCILLVEDVEVNREIVLALLEDTGIRFLIAENGRQAVEVYAEKNEEIDLVLMDIQMPELDGYEATRQIRAMAVPRAASVPIIAMTANVFREDVEASERAGMSGHIGKPLEVDRLMALLKMHLSGAL